jgi:hypothetical protein
MGAKPGLDLANQYLNEIQQQWSELKASEPSADDLVCLLVDRGEEVTIQLGPRLDYVEWLVKNGHVSPIASLQKRACDVEPRTRPEMAMWIVVPTPKGIGVMRIVSEAMPVMTSPGGDA